MKLSEQTTTIPLQDTEDPWQPPSEVVSDTPPSEKSEFSCVIATFLTTLSIFGIYLVQGVLVARILGPIGRSEFGTALYFPRDVLLYAGLFGGIEIVNNFAVKQNFDTRQLKYCAAKVGLISGIATAIIAAILTLTIWPAVNKSQMIPFCLFCCAFVPWEHMQLTISAVDRGKKNFAFYNINRLLYALAFPILVAIAFGLNLHTTVGLSPLWLMCILFVASRIVGILPTLRGMDLPATIGSLFGQNKKSIDAELHSRTTEAIEVPGPWKLLFQGRFYALSMLASELFERLDIFLIIALATMTESGQYFVAVPAATLITIAPNALAVFTFNAGADRNRKVTMKKAVAVVVATAALQFVSAVIFAFIVPHLILLLFKAPFAGAIPFALWLLPASAIKGFLQAADSYLKGRGKPMIGVRARALSILVMLGFVWLVYHDYIAWPEQKLLSVPIAACIGQAVSMVIITTALFIDVANNNQVDNLEGAN